MATASASASLLVPLEITAAMITAGTTVPVVDSSRGEVAWSSSTAYTGSESKINYNGRLYSAVAASTNVPPGTDTTKWRDTGPTNRMAPFDNQLRTQAIGQGSMEFHIRPGFFGGIAFYGLQGERVDITIVDAVTGTQLGSVYTQELWEQPLGLYEYLFMPLRPLTKKIINDLDLYPDSIIKIKISASGSGRVAVGMIAVGFWSTLLGSGEIGGIQYGASAQIKTYSYIKTEDDGTTTIIPRNGATNITCDVLIDADQANNASEILAQVASTPVAFIATGISKYAYLNTFGLVSGSVTPETWVTARVNLSIKGYI